MKNNIFTVSLYIVLIGGLVAGNWFGQVELLRISVWITLVYSFTTAIVVCLPSKDVFRTQQPKGNWRRVPAAAHLLLLVATGWFFTATMFAIAWISLWIKRSMWNEQQKKQVPDSRDTNNTTPN